MDETKLKLGLEDKILVENHLASHPNNSKHLLLSGMFVDSANTSNYGNFAAVSFDGGSTWENTTIFEIPEGADPWGTITEKGTVLSSVLGLEDLFLYRSEDNGRNWQQTTNFGKYHDHQTMVQDNGRNILYLVSIKGNRIYVNYSTDDGKSWDGPNEFRFSNLGSNTMTPVILEDGTLMVSYTTFNRPAIDGSRNNGTAERLRKTLSWTIPFKIESGFGTPMFISGECETGFPVLAKNPLNDSLYYVCSEQSNNEVLFHYSSLGGKSWSAAIPIAPFFGRERSKRNPFTGIPQVAVNNSGIIGLVWQSRMDDPEGKCQYLYFTASLDGGKTFLQPKKVSRQLSCMEKEENGWAGKRYKSGGDYTGFTTNEDGHFMVVWPDSRNGISQLYMAKVLVKPN